MRDNAIIEKGCGTRKSLLPSTKTTFIGWSMKRYFTCLECPLWYHNLASSVCSLSSINTRACYRLFFVVVDWFKRTSCGHTLSSSAKSGQLAHMMNNLKYPQHNCSSCHLCLKEVKASAKVPFQQSADPRQPLFYPRSEDSMHSYHKEISSVYM